MELARPAAAPATPLPAAVEPGVNATPDEVVVRVPTGEADAPAPEPGTEVHEEEVEVAHEEVSSEVAAEAEADDVVPVDSPEEESVPVEDEGVAGVAELAACDGAELPVPVPVEEAPVPVLVPESVSVATSSIGDAAERHEESSLAPTVPIAVPANPSFPETALAKIRVPAGRLILICIDAPGRSSHFATTVLVSGMISKSTSVGY